MKLVSIKRAGDNIHKFVVVVEKDDGSRKTIRFGAAGMSDYTMHRDEARRQRYLDRHRAREDWNDPLTAGFWSKHLLWGDTPSFAQNLALTKKRYDL